MTRHAILRDGRLEGTTKCLYSPTSAPSTLMSPIIMAEFSKRNVSKSTDTVILKHEDLALEFKAD